MTSQIYSSIPENRGNQIPNHQTIVFSIFPKCYGLKKNAFGVERILLLRLNLFRKQMSSMKGWPMFSPLEGAPNSKSSSSPEQVITRAF